MTSHPLPLDGVKVVDFSQGVAGPHAGLLCALQGADVVKVEPTVRGDWSRVLGRNYGDASAFSIYYNRGKRSLALDLATVEGRDIAYEMASKADVVIEAFRPGVMKRLGLDYEKLVRDNKDVIYLAVTGFGQTGANAQRPATDAVIQGYSGIMMLNKDREGVPQRFPMVAIDVVTGLYGFQAIMGALMQKFRFGGGRYIECNLMQCSVAFQSARLIEHHFQGGIPDVMYVPLGALQTSDGFISISVQRDDHFAKFCTALQREDLSVHPRYARGADRIVNEQELMTLIRSEFAKRNTKEWVERLTAADVLHAPIRTYDDVLSDEEIRTLGALDWLQQDGVDMDVPVPNVPGTMRASEYGSLAQSPHLGEHSRIILSEFGKSGEQIEDLLARGIAKQFG